MKYSMSNGDTIHNAIMEGFYGRERSWGPREMYGIEKRIRLCVEFNAKLMDYLVQRGIMSPDDITDILPYDVNIGGSIVEVPSG